MNDNKPKLKQYINNRGLNEYFNSAEEFSKKNPQLINFQIDLAFNYARARCYNKYEGLVSNLLEKHKNNNLLNRLHGRYLLFVKKDIEKAKEHLLLAVENNPTEPCWVKYFSGRAENYYERVSQEILYTPIPKNGSTTLKNHLARINNLPETINPHQFFDNPYFKSSRISKEDVSLASKILVLRDPLSRVKSYYNRNILQDLSLHDEIGSRKIKKIFGLDLKPSLPFFIENLNLYAFCFHDVLHHTLPQSAYISNLADYDLICDVKNIESAINFIDVKSGMKIEGEAKRMMVSSHRTKTSNKEECAIRSIYADDYKLLEKSGIYNDKTNFSYINSEHNKENDNIKEKNNPKPTEFNARLDWISDSLKFLIRSQNNIYKNLFSESNSVHDVYTKIINSIEDKKPLSLIRIGDGEGLLLGHNTTIEKNDIDDICKIHFGKELKENEIIEIKKGLESSIEKSDLVGIPSLSRSYKTNPFSRIQRGVLSAIDYAHNKKINDKICQASIHIDLDKNGLLDKILNNIDNLSLVTCRAELKKKILQKYNLTNVTLYKIPAEFKYGGVEVKESHYPEVYEKTIENLHVPYNGHVFFVAAGLLGKLYCKRIKELGGIAIDIGSIADAWAGVESRPYIKNNNKKWTL